MEAPELSEPNNQMQLKDLINKFWGKVKENLLLWGINVILLTSSVYMEVFAQAATRPFSVHDIAISYPFVINEKYDNLNLVIISALLPLIVMTTLILVDQVKGNKVKRFYHTVSLFIFCMSINGFSTTFTKIRLAKLRPDFLARCGPLLKKDEMKTGILYGDEICSAPFGEFIFKDGYKSCPSGHSSVSMCGMLFLSIWLYHSYGKKLKNDNNKNLITKFLCFAPILMAIDVITSRIYDFKHSYNDVICGTIVGILSVVIPVHYYNLKDIEGEEEIILPV